MINWIDDRKGALLRLALVVLALINQVLTLTGHAILPISDEQLTDILTNGFTIVVALYAWWKNNSITEAAIQADEIMRVLKHDISIDEIDEVEEPDINLDSSKYGLKPSEMLKGDYE